MRNFHPGSLGDASPFAETGGVLLSLGLRWAKLSFIHPSDKQLLFVAHVSRAFETSLVIAGSRMCKVGKAYPYFQS